MYAMPKIAAYDSWNPISETAVGSKARCSSRDAARIPFRLVGLPVIFPISFKVMNMNALVIEAPAPVASV